MKLKPLAGLLGCLLVATSSLALAQKPTRQSEIDGFTLVGKDDNSQIYISKQAKPIGDGTLEYSALSLLHKPIALGDGRSVAALLTKDVLDCGKKLNHTAEITYLSPESAVLLTQDAVKVLGEKKWVSVNAGGAPKGAYQAYCLKHPGSVTGRVSGVPVPVPVPMPTRTEIGQQQRIEPPPSPICRDVIRTEKRPFMENVCDYGPQGPVNCRNVQTRWEDYNTTVRVCN